MEHFAKLQHCDNLTETTMSFVQEQTIKNEVHPKPIPILPKQKTFPTLRHTPIASLEGISHITQLPCPEVMPHTSSSINHTLLSNSGPAAPPTSFKQDNLASSTDRNNTHRGPDTMKVHVSSSYHITKQPCTSPVQVMLTAHNTLPPTTGTMPGRGLSADHTTAPPTPSTTLGRDTVGANIGKATSYNQNTLPATLSKAKGEGALTKHLVSPTMYLTPCVQDSSITHNATASISHVYMDVGDLPTNKVTLPQVTLGGFTTDPTHTLPPNPCSTLPHNGLNDSATNTAAPPKPMKKPARKSRIPSRSKKRCLPKSAKRILKDHNLAQATPSVTDHG